MKRRSTATKDAVLSVLSKSGKALSKQSIEKQVGIDIDRATIYRVLNRFCDDGVLHKIVAEDGRQYFAICQHCDEHSHEDNHFHFRCTRCDSIECMETPVHFSLPKGYEVNQVNCLLIGVCKECVSK